jgi:hypothetical protein
MQDDQNVMLDRLRNVKGMILDELEDESAQRSRYADAARDVIRKLAESGAAFARGIAPVEGTISDWREADECARDLAVTLTVALRKRIMADGSGEGSDRANIAYREWRGARVERLCGDIARRAFNVGVVAACTGNAVRVIVAPDHQACDACALDAASGSHQVGTRFPSGKPHPPLHAGCNCAVVPG